MENQQYNYIYKIVLIGDAAVGKSALINKYVRGKVPKSTQTTIGVEFATRSVQLKDGGKIKAQIWDTAGQEKYRSITSAHYKKALGAMLVYDITKHKSFENLEKWIEEVKLHADQNIILMLVGNKLDIVEKQPKLRQVEKSEALNFAKKNNALVQETSAFYEDIVNDVFQQLFEEIYDQQMRCQYQFTTQGDDLTNSRQYSLGQVRNADPNGHNNNSNVRPPYNNSQKSITNNNNKNMLEIGNNGNSFCNCN